MTEKQIQEIASDTAKHAVALLSTPLAGARVVTFHKPGIAEKILAASFAATIEMALATIPAPAKGV